MADRLYPPTVVLEGRTLSPLLPRILSLEIFFQKRRLSSDGHVSLVAESRKSIQLPLLVLLDLSVYRDTKIECWLSDSNVPSGFRQSLTREIVSMATKLCRGNGALLGCQMLVHVDVVLEGDVPEPSGLWQCRNISTDSTTIEHTREMFVHLELMPEDEAFPATPRKEGLGIHSTLKLHGTTMCPYLPRIVELDIHFDKRCMSLDGHVSLVENSTKSIQIPLLLLLDSSAHRDSDSRIQRCLSDANVPSELRQRITREIVSIATELSCGTLHGCEIGVHVDLVVEDGVSDPRGLWRFHTRVADSKTEAGGPCKMSIQVDLHQEPRT